VIPTVAAPEHWWSFLGLLAILLLLDLAVLNRGSQVIRARTAALNTLFFVTCAGVFAAWVGLRFGRTPALEFTTGYLIEYALSVDNLFVFLVVFSFFGVPARYQHRVLFWGIVGALVLRALFILAGAALLARFQGLIYLFGAFLLFTGIQLLRAKGQEVHPDRNPVLILARRFLRIAPTFHGHRFVVRLEGRLFATPLLMVLLVIEGTDVVFAVDSIPAIFGVTRDPFIVLTSNIFAILGLRSLYFVLADFMDRFRYLSVGLGFVLAFIGLKMVGSAWIHVPVGVSLGVIAVLLAGAVAASLLRPDRSRDRPGQEERK